MTGTAPNRELDAKNRVEAEISLASHATCTVALPDGRQVALRGTEFRILQLLAREPNRIFSRTEILDGINVGDYAVGERAVDVQIVSLRKKLGPAASRIETVRGHGYRLRKP